MPPAARFATTITPTTFGKKHANAEPLEKRTRQRKTLSCLPCHKSKVRCDRQQPCKRCVVGKRPQDCTYGKSVKTEEPPSPVSALTCSSSEKGCTEAESLHSISPVSDVPPRFEQTAPKPEYFVTRKGYSQWFGGSHFRTVTKEFVEFSPYVTGEAPGFSETFRRLREVKKLYPSKKNRNYPFGESGSEASQTDPLSFLPPRLISNVLIEAYFESFGYTHRLFHRPTFEREVNTFWEHPQAWVNDPNLSQLFMVLALGCHAYDAQILAEAGFDKTVLIDKCVEGAQLSFRRGRFMSKPTLSVVRTLCLMALAQQMDIFNDSDAVWILLGLVIRLAIAMGLHQDPQGVPDFTDIDADVRRRVWACIVFLNLQSAIECGMPALLHRDDFNTRPPLNLNDEDLVNGQPPIVQPEGVLTEASLQIILADTFDVVTKVVDIANAPLATIDDVIVSDCDVKLRKLLNDGETLFSQSDTSRISQCCQLIQRSTYKAHIRHAMLVPHQCYITLPVHLQKAQPAQGSHWGILDSSLALLVLQRNLEDVRGSVWLTDLLKDHFVVAAIHVGVGLRRGDYSCLPAAGSNVSPQDTAYETLKACLEIWGRRVKRTVDNYKLHIGLAFMIYGLEALRYGTPMLEAMQRAAENSIAMALRP